MSEKLKAAKNSAERNVFQLGVILAPLFGFLLANGFNHNVWLSAGFAGPIFAAAVLTFGAGAISINRQRIANGEVYSVCARLAGIVTGILALLCIVLVY